MMSPSTARARVASLLGVLLLVCLTFLHREAAAEEKADTKDLPRIGFSNLVVRIPGQDQIGLANRNDRVFLIEHLRKFGFNMVGAESLVFEKDRTAEADYLLGGTLNELECENDHSMLSCRLAISWELLDVHTDEVVYRTKTRSVLAKFDPDEPERAAKELILRATGSLAKRKKLRKLLSKRFETPADEHYAAATFRACGLPSPAMPGSAEEALNATVIVAVDGGHGSGFVVSPDGIVVTAAHVVDRARKITVRDRKGKEYPAQVLRVSVASDIAILKAALPEGACLVAAKEVPGIGQEVYVLGAPASEELSFSLSRGIVSGLRSVDKVTFIQTDASVNPGNSGGPMLNAKGEAVGVVSRKVVGAAMEGLAFAAAFGEAMTAVALQSGAATSPELLSAAPVAVAPVKVIEEKADPVPSFDPEEDARRERRRKEAEALRQYDLEQAAIRERERVEAEKQAERDREEARRKAAEDAAAAARIDAITPPAMKVLRWSSAGVAVVGAAVALSSLALVTPTTSSKEYFRYATMNEVGWITAGIGAATFGASLFFIPPDPKAKSPSTASWQIVPSPFQTQGAF